MLAVPDESVHRTKVADWLELKAISSPDGRVAFTTLVSATALTENQPEEDIAQQDTDEDRLVACAQNELIRRYKAVGEDYPFRISSNGRALEFMSEVSTAGYVYLFCLFLSHASDRTIISKAAAPKITNKVRDLFQACSTVAAGGYVEGPSMSFGFPRPDGATFLAALHKVYKLFGDGKPRKRPRPAAAKKIKDNGIDIIAWRRSIDGLPGTLYLIGQVASGADWEDKSVVSDREHFHKYWFKEIPSSTPQDAMFMPFGLEPEESEEDTAYDEILSDHVQSIVYRFGTLFYRDRIAKYVANGMRLVNAGEPNIERHQDLPKIEKWVKDYTERLRAQ